MQQQTHKIHRPLATPKAFRRPTGAHAIIVSLLLADLFGVLLWLLIGAFAWPLLWWFVRLCASLLHASLLLDVGLVLILLCLGIGLMRRHLLKKNANDAWEWPGTLMFGFGAALILLFLVKMAWMRIPAPVIPAFPRAPFPWPLSLSVLGAQIAAGLSLLVHVVLWRRYRKEAADKLLPFSRAHPDGSLWLLLEQAYQLYRRGLSRFDQPPVSPLKTPPTFFYFPPKPEPDKHANPERDLYWVSGELVINQAYLSPKPEQTDILLPLVARLLHDYNSPVAMVDLLLHLARLGKASRLCRLLLWLPLLVATSSEQRWQGLERDRVLDKDRFAHDCGEGKRLRRLLRRQLEQRTQDQLPDNAVPTLAERIDHLDSLIGREARQIKELRAALPPAPSAPPTAAQPSPPKN